MLGIADYLWRLIPANPILLRVVETGGKRKRDMLIRCVYLGLLIGLVLFSLASTSGGTSLSDLAKESAAIFQRMSYLQLGLVTLLAPVFTAGAITQEKDSQTYDILLSTPLTNGQIVLGSLLSRLFFVLALLISGIPVFSITQIFGGVAIRSIVYSFLLAAATACVTGAMAMAIATFKVGTRRTIFSFAMFLVIFLGVTLLLDNINFFKVDCTDASGGHFLSETTWLTGLNPFLALRVIFGENGYHVPEVATLPAGIRASSFLTWYWTSPYTFFITAMMLFSLVLVVPSIVVLRRLAQSSLSLRQMILARLHFRVGERERKARAVWNNPIAWREARTKGSAARATIIRWGFIFCGVAGAVVLLVMHSSAGDAVQFIRPGDYDAGMQVLHIEGKDAGPVKIDPLAIFTLDGKPADVSVLSGRFEVLKAGIDPVSHRVSSVDLGSFPRRLTAADVRKWLLGATMIEFSVILLILTNAAASTVTREKEDGTLDLLLSTPITSRYYIWGKLRGLVSFVLPLIAVPIISLILFVIHDLFRWIMGDRFFDWVVYPEALIVLPGVLIIVSALAAILGMQLSLRLRTTIRAVMASVGIIAVGAVLLGGCGYQVIQQAGSNGSMLSDAVSTFSPFTLIMLMINPQDWGGADYTAGSPDTASTRAIVVAVAWLAISAYGLGVWAMYRSMVKNFDMTIRKQSR